MKKISGLAEEILWRGVYLLKLPTFSRKLEVAISRVGRIPFPPNIGQPG
jgi:hypothetical protein